MNQHGLFVGDVRSEHERLVAENNDLRLQLAKYENKVCNLQKWENCQTKLNRLREENRLLVIENEQLKKQVAELQGQVKILMNSHKILMNSHNMESKVALRVLMIEVKRKGLDHFSDDVARLTKKLKKHDENIAAHVAMTTRILEAIEEQKVERTKNTLMEMFEGVYGNYENDLDDEFSIFDDF
jgi:hypothetical protein